LSKEGRGPGADRAAIIPLERAKNYQKIPPLAGRVVS